MNDNYLNPQKEASKSGYTPNVQVTTGTFCVTVFSSHSSDASNPERYIPRFEERPDDK